MAAAAPQVPAAERTIAIMRHLAERHRPVPAASIARALGLPRSTTYHLLDALERGGLVTSYPQDHTWGLGIATFEWGQAYLRQLPLERIGRPVVRALADRLGQTVHLAVLHGNEVLYLLKEGPPTATPLVTEVGVRLPAHLTATGRAMLSLLSTAQVRALFAPRRPLATRTGRGPHDVRALIAVLETERGRGWSMERGEIADGIASVAAPVRGPGPVAAIGTSLWEPGLTGSVLADVATAVMETAARVAAALG